MSIITRKPFYIDETVEKTCVNIMSCCGEQGIPDNPFVIRIKRAGQCNYLIEYDGHIEGDKVCFKWDKLLYNMECGRYIGDIYEHNTHCDDGKIGTLQFDVNTSCWQATKIKEVEDDEDAPICEPEECDCHE